MGGLRLTKCVWTRLVQFIADKDMSTHVRCSEMVWKHHRSEIEWLASP